MSHMMWKSLYFGFKGWGLWRLKGSDCLSRAHRKGFSQIWSRNRSNALFKGNHKTLETLYSEEGFDWDLINDVKMKRICECEGSFGAYNLIRIESYSIDWNHIFSFMENPENFSTRF